MMRTLSLTFLLFFALPSFSQKPNIYWQFANPVLLSSEKGCVLQLDVEISSTMAGTYHSDLQVYFDYNTAAFGQNIVANNHIVVEYLEMMQGEAFGQVKYFVNNYTDNTGHTFAILTESTYLIADPMYMNEVPQYPVFAGLFRFRIQIQSPSQVAGMFFRDNLMDGGNYFISSTYYPQTKYGDPPDYQNLYMNDLMNQPLDCSAGCPETTTGKAVEVVYQEQRLAVTLPADETGTCSVFDMTGRNLLVSRLIPGLNLICLHKFPDVCLVRVLTPKHLVTRKIILR
jgi:hypothetical protein